MKNENTMHKNLQNASKEMIRGKLIALNASIREAENIKIN